MERCIIDLQNEEIDSLPESLNAVLFHSQNVRGAGLNTGPIIQYIRGRWTEAVCQRCAFEAEETAKVICETCLKKWRRENES